MLELFVLLTFLCVRVRGELAVVEGEISHIFSGDETALKFSTRICSTTQL